RVSGLQHLRGQVAQDTLQRHPGWLERNRGQRLCVAIVLQYLDDAAIGEKRHGESSHTRERRLVVERSSEHVTGPGEEALGVLELLALGDVTDDAGRQDAVLGLQWTEADLNRKFRAVLAAPGQLERPAHRACTRRLQIARAMAHVRRA